MPYAFRIMRHAASLLLRVKKLSICNKIRFADRECVGKEGLWTYSIVKLPFRRISSDEAPIHTSNFPGSTLHFMC